MKNFIFFAFVFSLSAVADDVAIYGEDNRKDVFETTNPVFVKLAKSTAAMIVEANLNSISATEIRIQGVTLEAKRKLCAQEKFAKQMVAARCSGFLIAENKLVTAGHCIKTEEDCKTRKWVFDFKQDAPEDLTTPKEAPMEMTVPASNVYGCKSIISQKLKKGSKLDYAVIELDRNVTDRQPLKFRQKGRVQEGDSLVVIGHPSGLPTKIADEAKVLKRKLTYFVTDLDTFGGNSGSAVINVKTEEVEGILVRGEEDYTYDPRAQCSTTSICTEGKCDGEEVTNITMVKGLK